MRALCATPKGSRFLAAGPAPGFSRWIVGSTGSGGSSAFLVPLHLPEALDPAAAQAADKDFDGVICGHSHHLRLRTIEGTQYVNTGDGVESCTALAEHRDGQRVPAEALDSDLEAE